MSLTKIILVSGLLFLSSHVYADQPKGLYCQNLDADMTQLGIISVSGVGTEFISIQVGRSPNFTKLGSFTPYGDPADWTQFQFRKDDCLIDTGTGFRLSKIECSVKTGELLLLNGNELTGVAKIEELKITLNSNDTSHVVNVSFKAGSRSFDESIEFPESNCRN